ncbi:hypothetical protein HanRHA438_Chr02g0094491 [Helianthus annuus]|nr:hypothetical protein HanIR_Chr02g0096181 [Helianthus annuus]KAJ0941437.1 hypothetical protein HanRHA438_Chr02g0094491 [Helianthus annuus]
MGNLMNRIQGQVISCHLCIAMMLWDLEYYFPCVIRWKDPSGCVGIVDIQVNHKKYDEGTRSVVFTKTDLGRMTLTIIQQLQNFGLGIVKGTECISPLVNASMLPITALGHFRNALKEVYESHRIPLAHAWMQSSGYARDDQPQNMGLKLYSCHTLTFAKA